MSRVVCVSAERPCTLQTLADSALKRLLCSPTVSRVAYTVVRLVTIQAPRDSTTEIDPNWP